LIEFSKAWCDYCEALEEDVLKPIVNNNIYGDRIIIRKLEVNNTYLVDARGDQISAVDFAVRHDVDFFPTLLFFDGDGKEVSRRIIGITTFDYMGAEIDNAVETAVVQMQD